MVLVLYKTNNLVIQNKDYRRSKIMCIFCRIADKEVPSYTIYEDELFTAFLDISQATIGHTLVIPKKHYDNILKLDSEVASKILPLVSNLTKALSKALKTNDFNIINNCGGNAGQTVDHFHIHIIPRYAEDGLKIAFPSNKLTPEKLEEIKQKLVEKL